jgi:hypothetical protein
MIGGARVEHAIHLKDSAFDRDATTRGHIVWAFTADNQRSGAAATAPASSKSAESAAATRR